jgi:hypothetical protein
MSVKRSVGEENCRILLVGGARKYSDGLGDRYVVGLVGRILGVLKDVKGVSVRGLPY